MSEVEKTPLQLAREASAKRAEARRADDDRLELEEHELEAKYEGKADGQLGRRHKDFDILRTTDGCVVVKLGDATLYRVFSSLDTEDLTPADWFAYVAPQVVHPDRATFSAIVDRHALVCAELALMITRMHQGKVTVQEGK